MKDPNNMNRIHRGSCLGDLISTVHQLFGAELPQVNETLNRELAA